MAFAIGTVFYLLLAVAFVGAVHPRRSCTLAEPAAQRAALGPYITLTTQAGLGWLATLLPSTPSCLLAAPAWSTSGLRRGSSYGLGRNGYFPRIISYDRPRGVPIVSIVICFVIGMLTFLPFPDWYGLVGLITSATVIMYAMAPLALTGLRKQDPTRERKYKLPAAPILCPVAFVLANIVVYVSGYAHYSGSTCSSRSGLSSSSAYQVALAGGEADDTQLPLRVVDLPVVRRAARYFLARPVRRLAAQGVRHNPAGDPSHRRLVGPAVIVAVMSLVVYYVAINSGMPTEQVQVAVRDVEIEASIELEEASAVSP